MIEKLLKYQEVDGKLKEIEDEIRSSEEYKKYGQASMVLKASTEKLNAFEERSKSLIGKYTEFSQNYKTLLENKSEYDVSVDACGEEELAYMAKKSMELSKKLAVLENDIVVLEGEIIDVTNQYKKYTQTLRVALSQRDEFKQKYEELVNSKADERKKIVTELQKLEKGISVNLMEKYKEKRKDNRFPIVCKVDGKYCSACRTELSGLALSKLSSEKIIECENCRKLIYIE